MNNRIYKNRIKVRFLYSILLIMLLILGLSGCGKKKGKTEEATDTLVVVTTEATTEKKTEAVTEEKTEKKTEATTEGKTEKKTEATTEEKTEKKTESETEDITEETTEEDTEEDTEEVTEEFSDTLDEDGSYYSKDEVALYIHTYNKLPSNYITKKEAKKLGWNGGSLEKYAPGKVIGGDVFGNYEGVLPDYGKYHECDIDTKGKKRGKKRIVYSDDGRIYYSDDHYESFELLYGEER